MFEDVTNDCVMVVTLEDGSTYRFYGTSAQLVPTFDWFHAEALRNPEALLSPPGRKEENVLRFVARCNEVQSLRIEAKDVTEDDDDEEKES